MIEDSLQRPTLFFKGMLACKKQIAANQLQYNFGTALFFLEIVLNPVEFCHNIVTTPIQQIDGTTDEVMSLLDPAAKWEAFGFKVFHADGHDVEAISHTIDIAKAQKDGKPTMIVLDTIKGKGVTFIEEEGPANHSMSLNDGQITQALDEIYGRAE